jgi:AcrR family transcriptional regulator
MQPMAKPAQRVRQRLEVDERRAQLVKLAIDAFSKRPFDEVSVDDIAKVAGISKGLLYHYFPTKRDLYLAGFAEVSDRLLAETLTPASLPPEERVRHGLVTYLAFAERHGPAYVTLFRGGLGADARAAKILEQARSTFVERIVEALPEQIKPTPLMRTVLRGWVGFVEAAVLEWLSSHRAQRAANHDRLVELMISVLLSTVMAVG